MNLPVGPSGHLFYIASRPVFQAPVQLHIAVQPYVIFQRPAAQGWAQPAADPWLHPALHQVQLVWMTAVFNQLHFMALAVLLAPAPAPRFKESHSYHPANAAKVPEAAESAHWGSEPVHNDRPHASASRPTGSSHQPEPADEVPPSEPSPEYKLHAERMTQQERRQYLQEMGFSANSNPTDSEIKKAYRALALKYHPDKTADLPEQERTQAMEKFKAVADAFRALMNPDRQPATAG